MFFEDIAQIQVIRRNKTRDTAIYFEIKWRRKQRSTCLGFDGAAADSDDVDDDADMGAVVAGLKTGMKLLERTVCREEKSEKQLKKLANSYVTKTLSSRRAE